MINHEQLNDANKKLGLIELWRNKRKLSNIVDALINVDVPDISELDFCVRPNRELGNLQHEVHKEYGYGLASRDIIPRSSVTLAKSQTAFGLYYGTSNFLEYRSHRFIIEDDALGITYHREAFNVDCQSIGSRALNLGNLIEIAVTPDARSEFDWLHDKITSISPDSWQQGGRIAISACS